MKKDDIKRHLKKLKYLLWIYRLPWMLVVIAFVGGFECLRLSFAYLFVAIFLSMFMNVPMQFHYAMFALTTSIYTYIQYKDGLFKEMWYSLLYGLENGIMFTIGNANDDKPDSALAQMYLAKGDLVNYHIHK